MGTLIMPSVFRNARCAEFNGTNEYMVRTGTLSFRSDTAGAMSMWIRIPATFGSDQVQFCGVFYVSDNDRILIGVRRIVWTGTGTFFSFSTVRSGTVRGYSATTTALTANTWFHVVLQSTGTSYEVYVNGTAQTITQWFGPTANNGDWCGDFTGPSARLQFGANYVSGAPASYYAGRLDEFDYVSGRALTSGEVSEIYNSGTPRNPHKLSFASEVAAWWRFGDSRDSATTVFDEIGTNDLTLVNMDATNYVGT